MASSLVASLPDILIFLLTQIAFIQGVDDTGTKI
jgi:ABC-type glycerol-3-phosphate transport system permease component